MNFTCVYVYIYTNIYIYIYMYAHNVYMNIHVYIFKRKINTTFSFKLGSTIDDTSFRRVDGSVQVDAGSTPEVLLLNFISWPSIFRNTLGSSL